MNTIDGKRHPVQSSVPCKGNGNFHGVMTMLLGIPLIVTQQTAVAQTFEPASGVTIAPSIFNVGQPFAPTVAPFAPFTDTLSPTIAPSSYGTPTGTPGISTPSAETNGPSTFQVIGFPGGTPTSNLPSLTPTQTETENSSFPPAGPPTVLPQPTFLPFSTQPSSTPSMLQQPTGTFTTQPSVSPSVFPPTTVAPTVFSPTTVAPAVSPPTTDSPTVFPAPILPPTVLPLPTVPPSTSPQATDAPTGSPPLPTLAPIAAPIPTVAPTSATLEPTPSPTLTTEIPTAATPAPSQPPSAAPIPTQLPGIDTPTQSPTTKRPSLAPTKRPSIPPSAKPTGVVGNSLKPSPSTPSPSSLPSQTPSQDPSLTGLNMTLFGIASFPKSAASLWKSTTESYIEQYFRSQTGDVQVTNVSLTILNVVLSTESRRRQRLSRRLQSRTPFVVITYSQQFEFQSTDPSFDRDQVNTKPFSGEAAVTYSDMLRTSHSTAFNGLTRVSVVDASGSGSTDSSAIGDNSSNNSNKGSDSGLSMTVTIVIGVVGGFVGLVLLIALFYYTSTQKGRRLRKGYVANNKDDDDSPPTHLHLGAGGDDISTLADPMPTRSQMGLVRHESYGDQSVVTENYDFPIAYGGAGDASLLSAAPGMFDDRNPAIRQRV